MMGFRIELKGSDTRYLQRVVFKFYDANGVEEFLNRYEINIPHAGFKRACCEAFGLVELSDKDAVAELICSSNPYAFGDHDYASEVLAAASRRLA
jgi:hypothetical protein